MTTIAPVQYVDFLELPHATVGQPHSKWPLWVCYEDDADYWDAGHKEGIALNQKLSSQQS